MTYGEAVLLAEDSVRAQLAPARRMALLRSGLRRFWQAYDWAETTAEMVPFWLEKGRRFYGAPWVEMPTDFAHEKSASWVELGTDGSATRRALRVVEAVQPTATGGVPESISWNRRVNAFELDRIPTVSAPDALIEIDYKKTEPAVGPGDLGATFVMDRHSDEFVEYLSWMIAGSRQDDGRGREALMSAMLRDGAGARQAVVAPEPTFGLVGSDW